METCLVKYEHLRVYLEWLESECNRVSESEAKAKVQHLRRYTRYQYLYYGQDSFDLSMELKIDEASFFEWFFDNTEFNQGESE